MSYIKDLRDKVGNDWIILNACAVVIGDGKGRILLQKRSDNFKWGLPGGLMELDDSIEQCAIREVKEETNLDVTLQSFIGVFNNPFMRWREKDYARIISFAFIGEVKDGLQMRINDKESLDLQYFDYQHLPIIHSIDTLEIIQAYYNQRKNIVEGKSYHE